MKVAANTLNDMDLCTAIGQGNPGALTVAANCVRQGRRDLAEKMLDLDIVGPKVWICFKDLGKSTVDGLATVLADEQLKAKLAALGY